MPVRARSPVVQRTGRSAAGRAAGSAQGRQPRREVSTAVESVGLGVDRGSSRGSGPRPSPKGRGEGVSTGAADAVEVPAVTPSSPRTQPATWFRVGKSRSRRASSRSRSQRVAHGGEDLGLLDRVDAEVGLEVEVGVEQVGGVAGHLGDDLGDDGEHGVGGVRTDGAGRSRGSGRRLGDRRGPRPASGGADLRGCDARRAPSRRLARAATLGVGRPRRTRASEPAGRHTARARARTARRGWWPGRCRRRAAAGGRPRARLPGVTGEPVEPAAATPPRSTMR